MGKVCDKCEFLSGDGYEDGVCRTASATYVSVQTVRKPEVRLSSQNYMVDLNMPYRQLSDWIVEGLRDFPGHFRDENGIVVPTPGIGALLTDGAEWWFRAQLENGKWRSIDDVPRLRSEATGRWRLIATLINIKETVQPICRR